MHPPRESDVGVSVNEDLHVHEIKDGSVSEGHDSLEDDHVRTIDVHFVLFPRVSLEGKSFSMT